MVKENFGEKDFGKGLVLNWSFEGPIYTLEFLKDNDWILKDQRETGILKDQFVKIVKDQLENFWRTNLWELKFWRTNVNIRILEGTIGILKDQRETGILKDQFVKIGIMKDQLNIGILKDQFIELEFGRTNKNIGIWWRTNWNLKDQRETGILKDQFVKIGILEGPM